ncbi:hypothetical protein DDI74_05480 [Chryseobacterium gleum]|nr:hypothetical protein DDI74_05480 [Chryseobacterium gleum]
MKSDKLPLAGRLFFFFCFCIFNFRRQTQKYIYSYNQKTVVNPLKNFTRFINLKVNLKNLRINV